MYRMMTFEEKLNYFYNRIKVVLFANLFVAVIFLLSKLFLKDANYRFIILFILIMLLITLLIILLTKLFFPVNLFSKKVQITDGYIDEKSQHQFSDSNKQYYYGIAKSLDGSKSTRKKSIPECFAFGKPPVKIIIYNNMAVDFFFTRESYDYVKERSQKLDKKQILGFIVIGLIIIAWIVIMNLFL